MGYTEYNDNAPSVDLQESHDEAIACAQIEQDQSSHIPF